MLYSLAALFVGYLTVAQAASLKPWLRTAYDKHLLKYNALIMPTVTFVAPEIPQGKLTVKGLSHCYS